jgi:hypothetical protein
MTLWPDPKSQHHTLSKQAPKHFVLFYNRIKFIMFYIVLCYNMTRGPFSLFEHVTLGLLHLPCIIKMLLLEGNLCLECLAIVEVEIVMGFSQVSYRKCEH